MLPRKHRISRSEFPRKEHVLERTGTAIRLRCYLSNKGVTHAQFAVVVPKKYATTAVLRNRFKRMVYSVINTQLGGFADKTHRRCVVYPNKRVNDITPEMVQIDVAKAANSLPRS